MQYFKYNCIYDSCSHEYKNEVALCAYTAAITQASTMLPCSTPGLTPGQQKEETMKCTTRCIEHGMFHSSGTLRYSFSICALPLAHTLQSPRLTGHARCIYVHEIKEDHTHLQTHTDIRTYVRTRMYVRIYMRAQKHTYARTYHAHIRLMSTVASPFSPYFARSFLAFSSSRPTSVSTPKWSKTSCVLRV